MIFAGQWAVAGSYFFVSVTLCLITFQILRIGEGIPRFFSAGDLANVVKAAVVGVLMTVVVFFTATRLDGIPRSVPAIHLLVLASGLVAYRVLAHLAERQRRRAKRARRADNQNVIWIGLSDWSVVAMRFLRTHAPEKCRVIALLDERPRWNGRSVNGVQVFGTPAHLEAAIEEFAAHGVRTDRVVVGGETSRLPRETLAAVREVCARRVIDLVLMPQPVEFQPGYRAGRPGCEDFAGCEDFDGVRSTRPLQDIAASRYLRRKRLFDTVAALLLMLWLMPLSVLLAAIVLKDVGWPLLFWQLRLGQGGRELQIYKFRTWRAPFDRRGNRIPEELRISRVGSLLRRSRLDELPQLLNVLAGDMSLIGPRPLLAQDQPPNATVRLLVRPGITGWAQVNGGARLTPGEKEALDTWYICNASFWLDLRIIGMTLLHLFRGERRGETALAQAQSRQQDGDEGAPAATRLRLAPKPRGRRRDDGGKAAAVNS